MMPTLLSTLSCTLSKPVNQRSKWIPELRRVRIVSSVTPRCEHILNNGFGVESRHAALMVANDKNFLST